MENKQHMRIWKWVGYTLGVAAIVASFIVAFNVINEENQKVLARQQKEAAIYKAVQDEANSKASDRIDRIEQLINNKPIEEAFNSYNSFKSEIENNNPPIDSATLEKFYSLEQIIIEKYVLHYLEYTEYDIRRGYNPINDYQDSLKYYEMLDSETKNTYSEKIHSLYDEVTYATLTTRYKNMPEIGNMSYSELTTYIYLMDNLEYNNLTERTKTLITERHEPHLEWVKQETEILLDNLITIVEYESENEAKNNISLGDSLRSVIKVYGEPDSQESTSNGGIAIYEIGNNIKTFVYDENDKIVDIYTVNEDGSISE
ncbi:hypothetical protein [Paenibacillus endoradicis]|uniref:hypothetical protein n=1 Tax=Paenibacillus endoradicis TaxID=2972487 RepID=UPI00215983C3|nr:hypothetical protein [Paenibacillus endoradicis]MCR8659306.1 hypothetical protein [Paenibacillus endoradicis]